MQKLGSAYRAGRLRIMGAMTGHDMGLAMVLIAAAVLTGCSGGPMSFDELEALDIFPEAVGGKWVLQERPSCPFDADGYIQVTYRHTMNSGSVPVSTVKIWVIDKVTPKRAKEWLTLLVNGEHTSDSVKPLPPGAANNPAVKAYLQRFLGSPVKVNGRPGYELLEPIGTQDDSNPGYTYSLYYTQGRFVIGVEDVHLIGDVDTIKKDDFELLASLNVPD